MYKRQLFLRDIARVGRRTRDGIIWPQTALAQIGACVKEAGYSVEVIDAIGLMMDWKAFERYMWEKKPRYMIIHATAPTLTNDMRTTFLGKAVGTISMAIQLRDTTGFDGTDGGFILTYLSLIHI